MNTSTSPLPDPEFIKRTLSSEPGAEPQIAGTKEESPYHKHPIEPTKFSITPLELEAHLNQFVIGQKDAVSMLATKIATHYNRMRLESTHPEMPHIVGNIKPNVILIGPTGVGKTYIVKLIADYIKVPFVKGDATKFSETGYVGGDVEDLIRELVHVAGGNIATAERGIVYIDEIDKIAAAQNVVGLDVSRTGVQRNLLKIMEETEVDMKVPHDIASQMEAVIELQRTGKAERKIVNTRNILFIVSGAFSHLDEIVLKRLRGGTIGFGKQLGEAMDGYQWAKHLASQDLINYGFETEFVGRLPVLVKMQQLTVDDLYQILKSPTGSVMQGKKRDFQAYEIDLDFSDEALMMLAEQAATEGTGARGILAVMERLLLPFEKMLPGRVNQFTVTKETIEQPENELKRILEQAAIKQFQYEMMVETGIAFRLPDETARWAHNQATTESVEVVTLLKERLKNYPYGLKLMGLSEFEVPVAALEQPQEYLDAKIKLSFAVKKD